nr:transposase [Streptomyces colonosanans]
MITAWKGRHRSVTGHQGAYPMRKIVNAIVYQGRTGCQWAFLPHDLPPKSGTYCYFAAWRDDRTDQTIHEILRCQVREKARRLEDPNAAGIALLDQVTEHTGGTVRNALVDQGFKNQVVLHGDRLGIDVETVARNPPDKGFMPQPKR